MPKRFQYQKIDKVIPNLFVSPLSGLSTFQYFVTKDSYLYVKKKKDTKSDFLWNPINDICQYFPQCR